MGDFSRVNRPIDEAGGFYNRLAPWYDLLASSEKRFIRRGLELLNPLPGELILEIGFGTGYAQERIIPCLEDGFSAAVDISPGMAMQARKKLSRADLLDRSGLIISDSLPLPFSSNTFDGLFTSFTLELFDTPNLPVLLAECRRVIKPEGRLVIVSLSRDLPLPWMGRLYEDFHNRFPAWADCRPIPVCRLLEENGYRLSKYEYDIMWGIPVIIALSLTSSPRRSPRSREY
jgi:demethylmenaquinone methyltransferase/2-methoxy-6-polyprenyl-1,4-benzoquinol methylase